VSVNDCHLEGLPRRVECEVELLGGCPVWQFSRDKKAVSQCHDDQGAWASCDHYGTQPAQDDPQTNHGNTIACADSRVGRSCAGCAASSGLCRVTRWPTAMRMSGLQADWTGCGPWHFSTIEEPVIRISLQAIEWPRRSTARSSGKTVTIGGQDIVLPSRTTPCAEQVRLGAARSAATLGGEGDGKAAGRSPSSS
jgi:hypothetical protein